MSEKEKNESKSWTEEFQAAGDELLNAVRNLATEATVRRIIIKSGDNVVLNIPIVFGLGTLAIMPMLSALSIAGILATNHSIVVERQETNTKAA